MIDPQLRRVALLVAACFFMEILDGTIVVTAIPKISDALSVPSASAGLIVTVYLVTVAVAIPLSGWMTSRYGGRRVFLTAICVFTGASLGCGLSTSLPELVAMRVLQGVGGAMMVPVGRIVVFANAEKGQIVRLMSYLVWPALLAPVVAPLLGGVITTYAGWRWLFFINLPLGILAFTAAWRMIHDDPSPATPPLDRAGVVLICTGLGAVTYAAHLASEAEPDWLVAGTLALTAAGLLVMAIRHLLRTAAPLVDLGTLRIRTFAVAMTGSAIFWLVVGAIPFMLPLLFQTVFGWSAIKSGWVVMFLFAGNVAAKPTTKWLYNRLGFRVTLLGATTGIAASTVAVALLDATTSIVAIAAVLVLGGASRSIGLTGFNTLALSDVPPEQMRHANTVAATTQQLFAGLGVAVATLALRAGEPLGDLLPGPGNTETAFHVAFVLLALVALAAIARVWGLHPAAGQAVIRR